MTQLFYNPDALPEDRIKRTFVGRQWLLDELISLIRKQRKGAGVQHVLIVGPRGMGKTTIFLMLGFAMRESDLNERWQVVRFREESYGITDAGEFWMEALRQLSLTLSDHALDLEMNHIARECRSSAELESGCLALLRNWTRKHKKRLLLLVENFDEILDQMHSDEESSRLRNVLMNDGAVMLLAAASSFFEETRGYEQPLYNFFKVYHLEGLNRVEVEDLLRRRAELDGYPNFSQDLRNNTGRIRALTHFTGGNPRLVLMLYAVIAGAHLIEVKAGLEKLLDEVTPFFKAKTERLPAQQRKILDEIARQAIQTSEGQSPTAIGLAVRMTPNQVSAQLQRMTRAGYVRPVNVRGRAAYYTLSEPLFALWYQMRFGRDARERIQWLIEFLRVWYDLDQLIEEVGRTQAFAETLKAAGNLDAASSTVEFSQLLGQLAKERAEDFLRVLNRLSRSVLSQNLATANEAAEELVQLRPKFNEAWVLKGRVQLLAGELSDANTSFKKALDILKGSSRSELLALALYPAVAVNDSLTAKQYWQEIVKSPLSDDVRKQLVSHLLQLAYGGHGSAVLELWEQSEPPREFFPIDRAIRYALWQDDALIEKLSPEVRAVVEDMASKLRVALIHPEEPAKKPGQRAPN